MRHQKCKKEENTVWQLPYSKKFFDKYRTRGNIFC